MWKLFKLVEEIGEIQVIVREFGDFSHSSSVQKWIAGLIKVYFKRILAKLDKP